MCEAPPEQHVNWFAHWLEEVGRNTVNLYHQGINLCDFFGEILVVFVEACLQPRRFRVSAVVRQMYEVWIRALVIVGVLCFLIGVVIAYQGVQQLRQFGAETFTVEAVGIGMFRELGVLLTAIIVAGRSGSAFTAQIGTMQVNQEVDAMRTIGLNPVEWLVMPRIVALVISHAAARLLGRHDRPAGRRRRLHRSISTSPSCSSSSGCATRSAPGTSTPA